jgi:hypothetical protein
MTDLSNEPGAWRVNLASFPHHDERPSNLMAPLQWVDTSQKPWQIKQCTGQDQDDVIALVDEAGWAINPPA